MQFIGVLYQPCPIVGAIKKCTFPETSLMCLGMKMVVLLSVLTHMCLNQNLFCWLWKQYPAGKKFWKRGFPLVFHTRFQTVGLSVSEHSYFQAGRKTDYFSCTCQWRNNSETDFICIYIFFLLMYHSPLIFILVISICGLLQSPPFLMS